MRRVLSAINTLMGFTLLALVLALIIGPPLYLEYAGQRAAGVVTAKREDIRILTDTWARRLFVTVRYQAPALAGSSADATTEIAVSAGAYDQLQVGMPTQIRYLPIPFLLQLGNVAVARLETQPPFGSFLALLGTFVIGICIGVAVWLVLLRAWLRSQSGWLMLATLGFMVGGVLYIGSGWPAPAPAGPLLSGQARVRALHLVDRVWGGTDTPAEDAVEPYLIVELAFVPTGSAEPVVAVDMVDADSVPGLRAGATVAISYSAADPRFARINGAVPTYYWKNLRSFGIIALILGSLLLGAWGSKRWKAAHQASNGPSQHIS